MTDHPIDLTAGADGNIWISLFGSNSLAHMSTTGTGYTVLTLPPSGGFEPNSFPSGITTGPDGNVWYVTYTNKVGRVTPSGAFTEFRIPTTFSRPSDITTGPDGNLWFTEVSGNRVARVTPAGEITEFLLPHINSAPTAITSGPGGKVWFAEPGIGKIGSIDPATVTPRPAPCLTVTRSTTLTHDVGPCAGDGIAVTASNVTLNLNGHRVFAGPGRRVGDFAGIHLKGVSNVAVVRGRPGAQVTGFDAGVWIDGGANNVIRDLNIHDNLSPADNVSLLGDGIILFHSSGNLIDHNVVAHNGVFDGIGVLGLDSNRNTISNNDVHDNTDEGIGTAQPGAGTGIIVDSFLEFEAVDRGNSISANNVVGNTVRNNVSSGISSISNTNGQIRSNTVDHNGFNPDGSAGNPMGNGIGVTNDQSATRLTRDN
ncbi:MAG: right-handed parallel beta-helix repeat-containing protein, partial [Actinobacteria bacterium]|nr:right-handed parallel beta-helix repeat-containing protein [Actinomycetota bacterium]